MTVNTPATGRPFPVTITTATTDSERAAAQQLLAGVIPGIAPNAVPGVAMDRMYRPVVALAHDASGTLVGAALTCLPQVAAGIGMLPAAQRPRAFDRTLDKVSELDLVGVHPTAQGAGVGAALVQFLEAELSRRGVRYWFGNVTTDLHVARLRTFYTRLGFTCLPDGTPPPPFGGVEWVSPYTERPAYWFWKTI